MVLNGANAAAERAALHLIKNLILLTVTSTLFPLYC